MSADSLNYRIGVDVGDRSVGLAAIEFDDDGFPIKKLAMVTFRHDGGMDPATGKTPKSRKETAGVARRTMRMRRRKKKRIKELDKKLRDLGYFVPRDEEPQTYEAWSSRARLAESRFEDPQECGEHLVRAVRHMARHRGWRNPWWSFSQLEEASQKSSETFGRILERAQHEWGERVSDNATLGMLGALAANNNILLRPRRYEHNPKTGKNAEKLNVRGQEPILLDKVRQEDVLAELRRICKVQGIEDQYPELAHTVFTQVRPYVPTERVGKDPLQPMKIRASRASLEFQEFRIRDAVANLRIRVGGSERRPLTEEEYDRAVDYLMEYSDTAPPTWGEVADELEIAENTLIAPVIDDVRLNVAPYDRSSAIVEAKLKRKTQARQWWDDDANLDLRSQLILLVSDATDDTARIAENSGLLEVFESWSDEEKQTLQDLKFDSGRAAYSIDTLNKLNAYMHEHRVGLHEARQNVFGVSDTWRPPRDRLDEPTGQPTVDRVLTIVRRFILDCERAWGCPQKIVVEHARTGLMGPSQRADVLKEIARNRNANERIRQELREGGIEAPNRADIRRNSIIQDQESQCLYCGKEVGVLTAELDHIVPRAGGGSSKRENLAAVCRACNASKGSRPFAVWAGPARLERTILRLRELQAFKTKSKKRTLNAIIRRLKQREEDEPIDERSLASTSYAATSIRERLEQHFNDDLPDGFAPVSVDVYGGSLTRESRRAGGIDKSIMLRGQSDKNRFDVRHHAIDAAVMTLLNPSVAVTLEQRRMLKQENDYSSPRVQHDNGWRDFIGRGEASQSKFLHWKKTAVVLADLISEAIEQDTIPVVNPLRLRPQNGSVHKDTVEAVLERTVGDSWTDKQVSRIVDPNTYIAFLSLLGRKKELDADHQRLVSVSAGVKLLADERVQIFPEEAASILTPRGVVKIGDSIHHARLYGWKNQRGDIQVGMLRVFGAEFPWFMRESGVKDILRVPIPQGSQSYRDLAATTRKFIENGQATEFGWITQNDEIEISAEEYLATDKGDILSDFLGVLPEIRWKVTGIEDNRRIRLRPLLLSSEAIPNMLNGRLLTQEEHDLIALVINKGVRVVVSTFLALPSTKIIRRNNLGIPRWRGNGHLPTSLDIQRAATQALEGRD